MPGAMAQSNGTFHSKEAASVNNATMAHTSHKRARLATAVAVLGLAALLAGCSSGAAPAAGPSVSGNTSWADIVAAANKEGALLVYSSQPGSEVVLKDAFEKIYPKITVTVERITNADLMTQIDQQQAAGIRSVDVAFHGEPQWFVDRGKQGVLAPLTVAPDNEAAYKKFAGTNTGVPIYRFPFIQGYNTKAGGKPFSNIEEMVKNAEAEGAEVGYNDPVSSIAMTNQWSLWEKTYPGILKRMAALKHITANGTAPIQQSLGAGEIAYGVGFSVKNVPDLISAGAPVVQVVPTTKAGVSGVERTAGVLGNAPHPNAAQVYINWMMSKGGQETLTKVFAPAVGYAIPPTSGLRFDDIKLADPKYWTPDRVSKFRATWDALFKG
jgi:iron(III) transport system substrate-binding protein